MNKLLCHGLILTLLFTASPTVLALDCQIVARLKRLENLDGIYISRAAMPKQEEQATPDRLELCAGDKIRVEKRVTDAAIFYYQERSEPEPLKAGTSVFYYQERSEPEPLKAGTSVYEVKAVKEPCGIWCKLLEKWADLFKSAPQKPPAVVQAASRDPAEPGRISPVFMPLASDKGEKDAFYLFAGSSQVPIFWRGGEAPYRVDVRLTDENGQLLSTSETPHQEISLTLPHTEPGQAYHLTITPAQGTAYATPLYFTVPPFPLSPPAQRLKELAGLLCDSSHQWHLEIWRQLKQLPDNQKAMNFKATRLPISHA